MTAPMPSPRAVIDAAALLGDERTRAILGRDTLDAATPAALRELVSAADDALELA